MYQNDLTNVKEQKLHLCVHDLMILEAWHKSMNF